MKKICVFKDYKSLAQKIVIANPNQRDLYQVHQDATLLPITI